jgi:hypothetical protein
LGAFELLQRLQIGIGNQKLDPLDPGIDLYG